MPSISKLRQATLSTGALPQTKSEFIKSRMKAQRLMDWHIGLEVKPSIKKEDSDTDLAGSAMSTMTNIPMVQHTAHEATSPSATAAMEAPSSFVPSGWTLSLALVACGCACQAPAEIMLSCDRGCGDLVSLAEAVFGIAASAPTALRERRRRGFVVPLPTHLLLASSSVAFAMLMNRALASPVVPAIVLITLKNGGLVANVLIGYLVLGKRFSAKQMVAVLVVCAGLVLTAKAPATPAPTPAPSSTSPPMARSRNGSSDAPAAVAAADVEAAAEAALAITCACGALLARALSGAIQESALARSARRASTSELLFFRNVLALPAFALRAGTVYHHACKWLASPEVGGVPFPRMWLLLGANLVFDYLCKVLMTRLIATDGAVHATLALTLQKFCAFMISATLLTGGTLGPRLWCGTLCVLGGSLAYTTICKPAPVPHETKLCKTD